MKSLTILAIASAVAPSYLHGQAQEDYLNWIRQIQTEESANGELIEVVQDYHVEPKGTDQSPLGIPVGGALFQLWTLDTTSNESWLLDTAIVGAARPQAQIQIDAQDSHAGIPRTRADIPFSVTTSYFGLQALGEGVAEALTQVQSQHFLEASYFPVGQFEVLTDEVIAENRVDTNSNIFTSITPEGDLPTFKAKGVEFFSVETISENVIANAQIEVFPLSTGGLSNLPERKTLFSLPDFIGVTVDDAYPGSEVILEATVKSPATSPNDSPTERTVQLLHRNIINEDSEDVNVQFSEFDLLNAANGDEVTFRLIAKSIFDTIVLDEEVRKIDTSLIIRGSINALN